LRKSDKQMTRSEIVNLGDGFAGRVACGDRDVVLWIHAYTLDSACWAELWQQLPGWRHIGLDLPGHGNSLPLKCDEDLSSLTRRIGAVAIKKNVRHLVAASLGSVIALQMAVEYPGAFATLTLTGPMLGGGPFEPDIWSRYGAVKAQFVDGTAGAKLRDHWMEAGATLFSGIDAHPQLRERLRRQVSRHPWWELADASYPHLWHTPQALRELQHIETATLVFVGGQDSPAVKKCAYFLERTIPDCHRLDLVGLGHLCLLEDPSCAHSIIEEHWRAHPTPPKTTHEAT
jgi:pimeloyl-ACP methyl ester carboxylesterase